MPKPRKPPTVRQRRLAAELRRLRATADMSREHVSEQTAINEATLYRIESAQALPQRRTLLTLLTLYGVDDEQRAELVTLLKDAGQRGWLRTYTSELPEVYTSYISFESEAKQISNYQSLFVPGLLQTEAYTRALTRGTLPEASHDQIEARVQARMERQHLLAGDDPLKLWTIMDEAVIRRRVGSPEIMRGQLLRLREAADQPNVTVQVIPFDAGAHPGMPGSFVVLEFADPADPSLVYLDSMAGDLFLEDAAEIRRYVSMFEYLRATALSPERSASMMEVAAQELQR